MKYVKSKLLCVLTLSMLIPFAGITQASRDSVVCMPLRDAQAGIRAIESRNIELAGKDTAIAELSRFIDLQNKLIAEYDINNINLRQQIDNNAAQIKLLTQQREIANGNISGYQREIKKQKVSKWLMLGAGIVGIFTTMYIMK